MMPREEWQLLLWMVVVSSMYAVLYYLIRRYIRVPTGRMMDGAAPQRVFIAVGNGSIMFAFTLVLLGGVIDPAVLTDVIARWAGRTILLLYLIIVLVFTFSGLVFGYSQVFGRKGAGAAKDEKENADEAEEGEKRRSYAVQQRILIWTVVIALLTIISLFISAE